MSKLLSQFEAIVRGLPKSNSDAKGLGGTLHPFDERNIHPDIASVSQKLFDNGHFSQATFEAYKHIDKVVAKLSGIKKETGFRLMMAAFDGAYPKIQLTPMTNTSEEDEQAGYRFVFAGTVSAIRNPRGHEVNLPDTIDLCLDHLSVASVLLRRIEKRTAP